MRIRSTYVFVLKPEAESVDLSHKKLSLTLGLSSSFAEVLACNLVKKKAAMEVDGEENATKKELKSIPFKVVLPQ